NRSSSKCTRFVFLLSNIWSDYDAAVPTIGITGGISTGKSTFVQCLRRILPEAKFFDADAVARQLVDLEEVKQELLRQFGFGIFLRSGDLNREAVRTIIFQDPAKRRGLGQILHPRIRQQWRVQGGRHPKDTAYLFEDIQSTQHNGIRSLVDRFGQ